MHNIFAVLLIQAIEGTAAALYAIPIESRLQIITGKEYLARIVGISGIMSSAGKLIGVGFAYLIIIFYSPAFVFTINSIMLSLFVIYKLTTGKAELSRADL